MRTRDDVESYLLKSGVTFREIADNTWLVRDREGEFDGLAVTVAGPLVVFRLSIVKLSDVRDRSALFEELLTLNASDVVHATYGLSGDAVVLSCALRLEALDYSEFSGTLEDFSLAKANHHKRIARFLA